MTIFWPGQGCAYSNANSFEMEIPGRYSIYDFGALPGEKDQVVIFLSKNAAEYYRWTNHKLEGPIKLVNFNNQLIQLTDSDRLLRYQFFYDWNGDGQNELLVLEIADAEIFYFRQNQWTDVPIELPFDVSYFSAPTMAGVAPHLETERCLPRAQPVYGRQGWRRQT